MNRSSFPVSQCWRVALALCALAPLGAPSVRAQEEKPVTHNFEKIFAGSMTRMLRIHDPNVRALMREAIRRDGELWSYRVSPDGRMLIYWGPNRGTCVLRIEKGRPVEVTLPPRPLGLAPDARHISDAYAGTAAFSPNAKLLASGQIWHIQDRSVTIYDTRTWNVVRVLAPQENSITSVVFSRDGRRLVAGDAGGGVVVYDVASGSIIHRWHYKNYFARAYVAFSYSSEGEKAVALIIATPSSSYGKESNPDEFAEIWDTDNDQKVADFPELQRVQGGVFNSDGTQIAISGYHDTPMQNDQEGTRILIAKWMTAPMQKQMVVKRVVLLRPALQWTPDNKNLIVGVGLYSITERWDLSIYVIDAPFSTPSKP